MPEIFDHPHQVRSEEIDELGHANNLAYLGWMIRAAVAHSTAQGWPSQRYHELGSGWVVRSHQIEYLRPCFAGEALVVRTWVAATRRASSLRRYRILRRGDGKLLASAATEWAFVRFEGGTVTRIPPEVAEAFIVLGDDPPGIERLESV